MASQPDHLTAPRLGRYEIDTGGSTVRFTTRHLFGLLPVHGTFPIRTGTVDVVEPLAESGVRVEIDAAGIDTGNGQRDQAVRSARFLGTAAHPVITFVADQVAGDTVAGTLTVRGVSRPVGLSVERCEPTAEGFTLHATAHVDRTAFEVTAARGLAGRHLEVSLRVACVRR